MNHIPRVTALLVLAATPATAQDRDSVFTDSLIHAHTRVIDYREGLLSGPGMEFLLRETQGTQFVAVAENHNVREIPLLTTALFRALHDAHGFRYLALEQGALVIERAVAASRRGGSDAVWDLGRRVPQAFHFLTDQELEMIAEVVRLSAVRGDPVWGVDREYAATPVLIELVRIAPNAGARAAAAAMLDSARRYETLPDSTGGIRWLFERADSAALLTLRDHFRPAPRSRADFLLRDLELARLTGSLYRAHTDSTPSGFDSNRLREEWMVERFLHGYQEAVVAGDSMPRVLVKSGHWHIFRGLFRANIPTFGNFLSEFARANGRQSYHIWLSLINRPGQWWSLGDERDYQTLARAGHPDQWVLLDLRSLRPWAHAGRLDVSPEVRQLIFTYDSALLIGGGSPATTARIRSAEPADHPSNDDGEGRCAQ